MEITVKRSGNWNAVRNIVPNLAPDIKRSNRLMLEMVAKKAEKLAINHINKQDLNWIPLNPEYAAWKKKTGRSAKILVAKRSYLKSIKSKVNEQGNISFAGVFKGMVNEYGMSIEKYAAIMEYGSIKRRIPVRKLWKPVMNELKKDLKNNNFAQAALILNHKRSGIKG